MRQHQISQEAIKMAKKMVDTIFPKSGMKEEDANALLNNITAISLQDLSGNSVEWKRKLEPTMTLCFKDNEILLVRLKKAKALIHDSSSDEQVNEAFECVEGVLADYGLDEEEKDTLFTALACLGLHALQGDYLAWTAEPPFPELGES